MIGPYRENPFGRRDFVAQFRSKKVAFGWTAYIGFLALIVAFLYSENTSWKTDIVQLQQSLSTAFGESIAFLTGILMLITPNLTAFTVTMERQRKSIDLIESAPVTARQFLVGKLLSSYRLVWMLLFLALPIISVCVVVGGSTWTRVLLCFLLLSGHSLVYVAIGLMASVKAGTSAMKALLRAILWIIGYNIITGFIGASTIGSFASSHVSPWVIFLPHITAAGPYMVATGGTYPIQSEPWMAVAAFGIDVFVSHLFVTVAAANLNWGSQVRFAKMRFFSLALLATVFGVLTVSTNSVLPMMRGGTTVVSGVPDPNITYEVNIALMFFWGAVILAAGIPAISAYCLFAVKRQFPNGYFRFREVFNATPAGSLPFVVLMWLACAIPICFCQIMLELRIAVATLVLVSFFFAWVMGRLVSTFTNRIELAQNASTGVYVAVMAIVFVTSGIITDLYREPGTNAMDRIMLLAGMLGLVGVGTLIGLLPMERLRLKKSLDDYEDMLRPTHAA